MAITIAFSIYNCTEAPVMVHKVLPFINSHNLQMQKNFKKTILTTIILTGSRRGVKAQTNIYVYDGGTKQYRDPTYFMVTPYSIEVKDKNKRFSSCFCMT